MNNGKLFNEQRKTDENSADATAFRRSSLLLRSPPGRGFADSGEKQKGATSKSGTMVTAKVDVTPKSSSGGASGSNISGGDILATSKSGTGVNACKVQSQSTDAHADVDRGMPAGLSVAVEGSPRLALIRRMREMEEDAITQCKVVLDKMQSAMNRQKGISNDVKVGVSKISELLDVMTNYRRTWKKVEEEKMLSDFRRKTSEKLADDATPKSTNVKLPAPSPAISESCEKVKSKNSSMKYDETQKEGGEWQTVTKKVKKRKQKKKPAETVEAVKTGKPRPRHVKSEAVLIRPTGGKSYSEVLRGLRSNMKADESSGIRTIRKTTTGAILLEFCKGEAVKPDFLEQLKMAVRETADIRGLKPSATIEIRDLDSLTTKEEVEAAIRKLLSNTEEPFRTSITAPNLREQVKAFVTLSIEGAAKLTEVGTVQIGWITARMRACESMKRCYRCLGAGHTQANCSGPDRTNVCIRCGASGHKMKDCRAAPKCVLCADGKRDRTDHLPGSRRCPLTKS